MTRSYRNSIHACWTVPNNEASTNVPRNGTCDARNVRYVLPSPDAFNTTMRLYLAVIDHTGNAGATEVEVPILEPTGDPPVP